MKISKNALSEELIALANNVNESAAKLDYTRNRNFYNRLYTVSEALRTPQPEYASIVRIDKVEVHSYHIIQRVRIKERTCFLLGDAQTGIIVKNISTNQTADCVNGGNNG